jgi:hypothetical protein
MSYIYAVRGWLELSWPDAEVEGVEESPEEHAEKIGKIRELLTTTLTPEQLTDEALPARERYVAGWAFPQHDLDGTEYVLYGADVEEPNTVLAIVREVLALDPFADGYFSIEGEDGEKFRQWVIKSGKVFSRKQLFPDFEGEDAPSGYVLLSSSS